MGQFNTDEFNESGFNADDGNPANPQNRVFAVPGSVTPSSFGQLRFRVLKAVPGSDPDLVDGWIQDRYQAILDRLPWARLEKSVAVQTTAAYQAGAVTLLNGDTEVSADTLTPPSGVSWTQAMTGCSIRFEGRDEYYEFTATGPATGVIDRPYEGPGGSGLAYLIFETVYPLPGDCRELRSVRLLESPRPLERKSKQELDFSSANRAITGKPRMYAPYMDDQTSPPVMQFEVYPAPDRVMSLVIDYIAEQTLPGASSVALLPWMRPSALYEGARASALEQAGNYAGADRAEMKFGQLVQQMVNIENRNTPPRQLQMAPRFTRHRILSALYSQPRRGRPL